MAKSKKKTVTKMVTKSRDEVYDLIHSFNGTIFSTRFKKKTDGSLRDMTCRTKVKKYVKGVGMKYDPAEHNLICVYEMSLSKDKQALIPKDQRYRMINVEGLEYIFHAGVLYTITDSQEMYDLDDLMEEIEDSDIHKLVSQETGSNELKK